ncbi:MAG: prolyl oligopeptidase family serine peptidase [bacterium]|nr:prolyl oligopeptidase family serine peptidase [bacterium]
MAPQLSPDFTEDRKTRRKLSRRDALKMSFLFALTTALEAVRSRLNLLPNKTSTEDVTEAYPKEETGKENLVRRYFQETALALKETVTTRVITDWEMPFPYLGPMRRYDAADNLTITPQHKPEFLIKLLRTYNQGQTSYVELNQPLVDESGKTIAEQAAIIDKNRQGLSLSLTAENPINHHLFNFVVYKSKTDPSYFQGTVFYFRGIDRSDNDVISQLLTFAGYDVVTIGYAGAKADNTIPLMDFDFSDGIQMDDIKPNLKQVSKLNFFESEDAATALLLADTLGLIDSGSLIHVIGVSYGSTQAVNFSLLAEQLDYQLGKLVTYAGIHDFASWPDEYARLIRPLPFFHLSRQELFHPIHTYRKLTSILSPVISLPIMRPSVEKVVIIHGDQDKLVDPEQSQNLAQVLARAKIPYSLFMIPEVDHIGRPDNIKRLTTNPASQARLRQMLRSNLSSQQAELITTWLQEQDVNNPFLRAELIMRLGGFVSN